MTRFSLEAYRAVIETALGGGYRFTTFDTTGPARSGAVYLRHDVDYSLSMAVELARINADLGIRGSFMLLLRSATYNLLSPVSLAAARELIDLGQSIGFHAVVPKPLPRSRECLDERVRGDFLFVQRNLPQIEPVFSWHNPTPEVLELSSGEAVIGGLLNTYSAAFSRDIAYRSDSNMRNRPDELRTFFRSSGGESVQLLVHPLNWVAGGEAMDEVFAGMWRYVIREQEVELSANRWYAEVFPRGMPEWVVDAFAMAWRRAADEARGGSPLPNTSDRS
jgi:hypothetical protein